MVLYVQRMCVITHYHKESIYSHILVLCSQGCGLFFLVLPQLHLLLLIVFRIILQGDAGRNVQTQKPTHSMSSPSICLDSDINTNFFLFGSGLSSTS